MGSSPSTTKIVIAPPLALTVDQVVKEEKLVFVDLTRLPFVKIKPEFYNRTYANWTLDKYRVKMEIKLSQDVYPCVEVIVTHNSGNVHRSTFNTFTSQAYTVADVNAFVSACNFSNRRFGLVFNYGNKRKDRVFMQWYAKDFDPTLLITEIEQFIEWATEQEIQPPAYAKG